MKNVLLYLSAFIPMYVLIIIKQAMEIIFKRQSYSWLSLFVFLFLAAVIILGTVGLLVEIFNRRQKVVSIKIVECQNITDRHFLGYFSLFVLFAITFDLSRLSMFIVFVIILVMIGVVYVKNKLFYINPLLNILGFNFFSIVYETEDGVRAKTHLFCNGELQVGEKYKVKIKDQNFSFISRK